MNIPLRAYWRLLNRYLISQRGAAVFMAVLLLAGTGFGLAAPQVMRSFIDGALAGASQSQLNRSAIYFFIIMVINKVLGLFARYRVQHVAWTATNALRIDLVAHLVRLDLGFHKTHPPGELIARVDGDVEALSTFLSSFVVELIGGILLLVGILVVIYVENIILGSLFCIFALLSLILLSWAQRLAPPHWQAERECSASFWGFLGEVLTATEDIQSSGSVPYIQRCYLQQLQRWRPLMLRASLFGMIWLATSAAYSVGTGLSWSVGGPLVNSGTLTLGTLYMLGHYLGMLVWGPIQAIQWQLEELQHAQVSILRIQELFDTSSGLAEGSQQLPSGSLSITFNNVSFAYCDANEGHEESTDDFVLHNLTFNLEAGRVLGLLGRTGSGKTTIARLLFRWYDPQKGEVRLGNVDIRQTMLEALRARIGFVTQDVQLFQANLRDNLTFFNPAVTDDELITTLETLGMTSWLEHLPQGLDTPIASETLSAGEAQLVALARVFLKNPDIIILDEASSRLDPATEGLLGRVLDKLLQGRSGVVIAHRLQTVERADDIMILEEGQIVEYGTRQRLSSDPKSHYVRLLRTGIEEVLA